MWIIGTVLCEMMIFHSICRSCSPYNCCIVDITIGYWWWWIIRTENFKSLDSLWTLNMYITKIENMVCYYISISGTYKCCGTHMTPHLFLYRELELNVWSMIMIGHPSYWCFPYRKIPFYLRYWYCHEKKKQYHQILVLVGVGVGDNRSCTSLCPDQGRYMQIWDRFWILGQVRVTCFPFGKREGVAWYTMSRSIVYFCYNMWCRINIRDWLPWSRHK